MEHRIINPYSRRPIEHTVMLRTMSANSLGALVMIYATDELQNPLPLKTMLCEGDMNNPIR